MKTHFESVNEYIASQPKAAQATLRKVRAAIRKALPGVEEGISYGIATFKLRGHAVLALGGWKQHYSLYPSGRRLIAAFKDALAPYEYNDKGTIRFPLAEPVPVKLIQNIARFRAKEASEKAKAKAAKRR